MTFQKPLMMSVLVATTVGAVIPYNAAAAEQQSYFSDVSSNDYFYSAVSNLAGRGVITGYKDGTFRPYESVTRAQAAKMMALALGLDTTNVKDPKLKDVAKNAWYYGPVAALIQAGVIDGYEDDTFKPQNVITRAQMAKMIVLGFEFNEKKDNLSTFKDVPTNEWFAGYVGALIENGITTGKTPTTFAPFSNVTRGQLSAFIFRSEHAHRKEVNAKVQKVSDRSLITTDGKSYVLAPQVKHLLNSPNNSILKDAFIQFETAGSTITKVTYLALTQNGTKKESLVLDGQNGTLDGDLDIKGDFISVKNLTIKGDLHIEKELENTFYGYRVKVQGNVLIAGKEVKTSSKSTGQFYKAMQYNTSSNMIAATEAEQEAAIIFEDAELNSMTVNKSGVRVEAKGKTTIQDIIISTHATITAEQGVVISKITLRNGAKVTLGEKTKVPNLILPEGTDVKSFIENYNNVKANIEKINGQTNPDVVQNPGNPSSGGGGSSGGSGGNQTGSNTSVAYTNIVDGQHIKVQFTKPVRVGTGLFEAERVGYYTVTESGNGTAFAIDEVKLSADGLTAEIKLNAANLLKQDTAYTITVNKQIKDTEGRSLSTTDDYKVGVFFSDKVKPTVTSVVSAGNGDLEIKFNERLAATLPTVVINGKTATGVTVDGDTVKVPKAWFELNSSDIKKGTSYPIIVAGAKDLVAGTGANEMELYSSTIAYQGVTDTSAPTLTNVVVKNDHTLEVTFSEELQGAVKDGTTDNNIAAVFGAAGNIKVLKGSTTNVLAGAVTTKDGKTFKLPLSTGTDVLFDSRLGETSANVTVEAKGFKDKANNLGATVTQTINLVKDTTKPVLAKAEYDIVNEAFVFTFDQDLSAYDPAKVTVVNKSTGGVAGTLSAGNSAISGKTLTVNNVGGLGLSAGTYIFSFAAGAVKDDSIAQNSVAAFSSEVTATTVVGNKVKPEVTNVIQSANDTIKVTFNKLVKSDDTAGSATNANNYRLNGSSLPVGTVITYSTINGGTQGEATIKMPDGSAENSGTKVFTVSNVQDVASNVMDTVNKTVFLTDTLKPKFVSAKVDTDNKIVLTFSENVDGKGDGRVSLTSSEVKPVAGDFDVFVNGTLVAVVVENGAEETQIKLSSNTVNFASGTIVIKTKALGIIGADEAGNTLKAEDSITITR